MQRPLLAADGGGNRAFGAAEIDRTAWRDELQGIEPQLFQVALIRFGSQVDDDRGVIQELRVRRLGNLDHLKNLRVERANRDDRHNARSGENWHG